MAISVSIRHLGTVVAALLYILFTTSEITAESVADTTATLSPSPTSAAVSPSVHELLSTQSSGLLLFDSSTADIMELRKSSLESTTVLLSTPFQTYSDMSTERESPITSVLPSELIFTENHPLQFSTTPSSSVLVQSLLTDYSRVIKQEPPVSDILQSELTSPRNQPLPESITPPPSIDTQTSLTPLVSLLQQVSISDVLRPSVNETTNPEDTFAPQSTPLLINATLSALLPPTVISPSPPQASQSIAIFPTTVGSSHDPNSELSASFSNDFTKMFMSEPTESIGKILSTNYHSNPNSSFETNLSTPVLASMTNVPLSPLRSEMNSVVGMSTDIMKSAMTDPSTKMDEFLSSSRPDLASIWSSESPYIKTLSTDETFNETYNESLTELTTNNGYVSGRKDKAWPAWTTFSPANPTESSREESSPETSSYVVQENSSFTSPSEVSLVNATVFDPTIAHQKFLLFLEGGCSSVESGAIKSAIDKFLAEAIWLNKVQLSGIHCQTFINITLTVGGVVNTGNLRETLKSALRDAGFGEELGFRVIRVLPMTSDGLNSPSSSVLPPTEAEELLQQEVIAYIVVGVLFGILLLAAVVVVCAKCVCRHQKSKMELYDLPHVSLNMEDYKLTTIPRPSLVYTDCARDLSAGYVDGHYGRNGHVQADGIGQQPQTETTRHLKTFGRRRPNNESQASSDPGTRASNVPSRMSTSSVPAGDKWSSTEALTSSMNVAGVIGIENPNYRKWF